MSTQDENIAYDLLYFEKFYNYVYPNETPEHKNFYRNTILNGEIQISTFVENAVAAGIGIKRNSKLAMDLEDGSEVKAAVSCMRNNDIKKGTWMHTYEVRNVQAKTGPIRFIGWNKITKEFEYYFIPNHAFSHLKSTLTLPIETFSGYFASCGMEPTFTGIRTGDSKWHRYQVDSFSDMCKMPGPIAVTQVTVPVTPIVQNTSLPDLDYESLTKSLPIPQTSIPYNPVIVQHQTLDPEEIQPIFLSLRSL